jgi:hypothetical protein
MLLSRVIGGMMRKTALILGVLMAATASPKDLARALEGGPGPASQGWKAEDPTAQAIINQPLGQDDLQSLLNQRRAGQISKDQFLRQLFPRTYRGGEKIDGR